MLQMRTDWWHRYAGRSMVVLILVVMSGFFPAMAKAAPGSVGAYRYGYDWDSDAGECAARYYVHRGDTLSRIAARYGVSIYAIAHRNGIPNVNRIYPGQYLCIPGHDAYDWYDEDYRYHHDADEDGYEHDSYHHDGYYDEDGYGYGDHESYDEGDYRHGHHDADEDGYYDADEAYAHHEVDYGPVEEEYPDSGYYRTSGGHTGVCYYPDPRYNSEEAEFYEADERPDCS